jgi:hypothetical protein
VMMLLSVASPNSVRISLENIDVIAIVVVLQC